MFFLDCLYGEIDCSLDEKILNLPELQRLREIRLCNINSPYLTGGANISRFEHAIGTLYLAQEYSNKNELPQDEKGIFLLASLLHDVITPPFGHSLEYIFDAFNFVNYEHANFQTLLSGKTVMRDRPFFVGKKSSIRKELLDSKTSDKVLQFLKGEHRLSHILQSEIDIDNIDNVYRFAYHLGLEFDKSIPKKLALSLEENNGTLCVSQKDIWMYDNWYNTRKRLYKYLLENPGEFVAKATLEKIIIDLISNKLLDNSDWIRTDYEFVNFVLNHNDVPKMTKKMMQNLMTMKFPKYNLILRTDNTENMASFMKNRVKFISKCFEEKKVFLHVISDVNKTCRPLKVILKETGQTLSIGSRDDRFLIGLFGENRIDFDAIVSSLQAEFNINTSTLNMSEEYICAPSQLSLF